MKYITSSSGDFLLVSVERNFPEMENTLSFCIKSEALLPVFAYTYICPVFHHTLQDIFASTSFSVMDL